MNSQEEFKLKYPWFTFHKIKTKSIESNQNEPQLLSDTPASEDNRLSKMENGTCIIATFNIQNYCIYIFILDEELEPCLKSGQWEQIKLY